MHAQELIGTQRSGGQLGDAQGGGVGDENGLGLHDGSQLGEGVLLQLHILDHGLENDVDVGQVVQVGGGLQAAQHLGLLLLGDLALGDLLVKALLDAGDALLQGGGPVVVENHVVAALKSDLGDAAAHQAGAVHTNSLNFHVVATPLISIKIQWVPRWGVL